ncbi:hypothetical protein SNEBB_002344, partial [Seison nebaliae]
MILQIDYWYLLFTVFIISFKLILSNAKEPIITFVPTKILFSTIIPNIQCHALKCARFENCLGFNNNITGSFITSLRDLNENMFIRKEYFPLISKLGELQIDEHKIILANINLLTLQSYSSVLYNKESMAKEKPICFEVIFNYFLHNTYTAKNCGCYFNSQNQLKECKTAGHKSMDGSLFQETGERNTAFWGD